MDNLVSIQDWLIFFAVIIAMLFINSLLIMGFYSITKGAVEELPNGRKKKTGKIFFFIRDYFDKHWIVRIDANNEYTKKIADNFIKLYPHIKFNGLGTSCLLANDAQLQNFTVNQPQIEIALGYKFRSESGLPNCNNIIFYKEDKNYFWPGAFRSLIYDCPPCMSTIYGNLFFWTTTIFIMKFSFSLELFVISLFYWLSLAYMNLLIQKK